MDYETVKRKIFVPNFKIFNNGSYILIHIIISANFEQQCMIR